MVHRISRAQLIHNPGFNARINTASHPAVRIDYRDGFLASPWLVRPRFPSPGRDLGNIYRDYCQNKLPICFEPNGEPDLDIDQPITSRSDDSNANQRYQLYQHHPSARRYDRHMEAWLLRAFPGDTEEQVAGRAAIRERIELNWSNALHTTPTWPLDIDLYMAGFDASAHTKRCKFFIRDGSTVCCEIISELSISDYAFSGEIKTVFILDTDGFKFDYYEVSHHLLARMIRGKDVLELGPPPRLDSTIDDIPRRLRRLVQQTILEENRERLQSLTTIRVSDTTVDAANTDIAHPAPAPVPLPYRIPREIAARLGTALHSDFQWNTRIGGFPQWVQSHHRWKRGEPPTDTQGRFDIDGLRGGDDTLKALRFYAPGHQDQYTESYDARISAFLHTLFPGTDPSTAEAARSEREKIRANIEKFWNQKIEYALQKMICRRNGLHCLADPNHITRAFYHANSAIYFASTCSHITLMRARLHGEQPDRLIIPGSISVIYKVTDKGYVFDHANVSNSVLHALCTGPVPEINQELLKLAAAEEKLNADFAPPGQQVIRKQSEHAYLTLRRALYSLETQLIIAMQDPVRAIRDTQRSVIQDTADHTHAAQLEVKAFALLADRAYGRITEEAQDSAILNATELASGDTRALFQASQDTKKAAIFRDTIVAASHALDLETALWQDVAGLTRQDRSKLLIPPAEKLLKTVGASMILNAARSEATKLNVRADMGEATKTIEFIALTDEVYRAEDALLGKTTPIAYKADAQAIISGQRSWGKIVGGVTLIAIGLLGLAAAAAAIAGSSGGLSPLAGALAWASLVGIAVGASTLGVCTGVAGAFLAYNGRLKGRAAAAGFFAKRLLSTANHSLFMSPPILLVPPFARAN